LHGLVYDCGLRHACLRSSTLNLLDSFTSVSHKMWSVGGWCGSREIHLSA
jgi:hypothetical protein